MENRITELFQSELQVVNIGLEVFYEAVHSQNVPCTHVDWKPSAGGDLGLMELLEKLRTL